MSVCVSITHLMNGFAFTLLTRTFHPLSNSREIDSGRNRRNFITRGFIPESKPREEYDTLIYKFFYSNLLFGAPPLICDTFGQAIPFQGQCLFYSMNLTFRGNSSSLPAIIFRH